jgi:hypothetical protein
MAAEGTPDAEARETMLRMAGDYDHLASLISERIAKERDGATDDPL